MPYALQAHFDPTTDAMVRNMWQRISRSGIPSRPIEKSHFPHLTFVYGEVEDPDAFSWDFLVRPRQVPILFCSLGTFANDAGAVFLSPAITPSLRSLHEDLDRNAAFSLRSELYRPRRWYPHCTLATRLSRSHVSAALSALQHIRLPIEAVCTSLNLVKYPESETLTSIALRED